MVVATGTASGKSLAYQLPVLTAMATDPLATALYLSPTKALGSDQLRAVLSLTDFDVELRSTNASAYDGDTSQELRTWARENSRWLFTNPDMIHISLLRTHQRWAHFFRNLKYVIIDECHSYRGVFGSNVALVIRRLTQDCSALRRRTYLHPGQRDHSRSRRSGLAAHRRTLQRGHGRRIASRPTHRRTVGASATRGIDRRKR